MASTWQVIQDQNHLARALQQEKVEQLITAFFQADRYKGLDKFLDYSLMKDIKEFSWKLRSEYKGQKKRAVWPQI